MRKWKVAVLSGLLLVFIEGITSSIGYDYDYDDQRDSWNRCPWIRNKLKNGRVRVRSRGRIAKFQCKSGFELVGKRFATCVRGQWNNPMPVCVSRGCQKLSTPTNGKLSEAYRGAVLNFDCNPGYSLFGDSTIYCDGVEWNKDAPTCQMATLQPKTSCDFEEPDLCGWTHDPTHHFDWRRHQFSTPSGHVGTGPDYDHTYGRGKAGFYMYAEASAPRSVNDTSRLFSPVYSQHYSPGCFVFWYHMYGSTIGALRIYLKKESHVLAEQIPSWERSGDQGKQWLQGNVTIPKFNENFQIVIEGIRGPSYVGDTAIDDVSLSTLDCSSLDSSNSSEAVESSDDSCRGRCHERDTFSSCGCNSACVANNTCCSDYAQLCGESGATFLPEEPDLTTTGKQENESASWSTTTAKVDTERNETSNIHISTWVQLGSSTPSAQSTQMSSTIQNFTRDSRISSLSDVTRETTSSITGSEYRLTSTTIGTTANISRLNISTIPYAEEISTVTVGTTGTEKGPIIVPTAATRNSPTAPIETAAPTTQEVVSSALTVTTTNAVPVFIQTTNSMAPTNIKSEPTSTTTTITSTTITSTTTTTNTPTTATNAPTTASESSTASSVRTTAPISTTASTPLTSSTTTDNSPVEVNRTINMMTSDSILSSTTSTDTASTISTKIFIPSVMTSTIKASTTVTKSPTTLKPTAYNFPFTSRDRVFYSSTSSMRTTSVEVGATTLRIPRITSKISSPSLTTVSPTSTKTTKFLSTVREMITTSKPLIRRPSTFKTMRTSTLSTKLVLVSSTTESQSPTRSSEKSETHASVATVDGQSGSSPSVVGICIGVIIVMAVIGGVVFVFHRRRRRKNLGDDSEMRFLAEDEVIQYSEAGDL